MLLHRVCLPQGIRFPPCVAPLARSVTDLSSSSHSKNRFSVNTIGTFFVFAISAVSVGAMSFVTVLCAFVLLKTYNYRHPPLVAPRISAVDCIQGLCCVRFVYAAVWVR